MSRQFTLTESLQGNSAAAPPYEGVLPHRPDDAVDSTSIRWVFVATVAFWVAVIEAGRMFF